MFNYLFCSQVEESVLSSGVNKKLVLILNKIGEFELPYLMFGEHSILLIVHQLIECIENHCFLILNNNKLCT